MLSDYRRTPTWFISDDFIMRLSLVSQLLLVFISVLALSKVLFTFRLIFSLIVGVAWIITILIKAASSI